MPDLEVYTVSPEQRRVWALGGCGLRAGISVTGAVDEAALHSVISAVVQRHEILRTQVTVPLGDGDPVQLIGDTAIRWDILRTDDQTWQIRFDLPATVADRQTAHLLVDELARGDRVDAGVQYADVAAWLEDVLDSPHARESRRALLQHVTPGLISLRLPFESAQAASDGPPAVVSRRVPADVTDRLERFASDLACREDAVLLACWQVLLGRLTAPGSDSGPVVGVAVTGRQHPDLSSALGPLTRYLPVAGAPRGGSVSALAETASKELTAITEDVLHFVWPAEPEPGWPEGVIPFSPYTFAYEQWPRAQQAGGVRFALTELSGRTERFAVELGGVRDADGLTLELRHDDAALPSGYAQHLLSHYVTLLTDALDRPATEATELSLLDDAARRLLLAAGVAEPAANQLPDGVVTAFLAQAAHSPEAVAVVDGDREVAYGELAVAVDALAARLVGAGVQPGDPVAVRLDRGVDAVTAALAVLRSGGAYAPISRTNPAARTLAMLSALAPRVVLTDLAEAPETVGDLAAVPAAADEQTAYVIHTSGSTGAPHPVAVPHRALVIRLSWSQAVFPLRPDDRMLLAADLGFDFSVWEILAPLTRGASVIVADGAAYQDPAVLARLLRDRRVTVAHFTPALLDLLIDEPDFADLADLRLVMTGGAALSAHTARRFAAKSAAELANQYGPTEAAIDVTYWRHTGGDSVPIGHPAPGCTVWVLDSSLRPAPVGVTGEIHIGGGTLATGYPGLPAQSAARFVADPYGTGTRMYRTGDLGRVRWDGAIEFLGRLDDEVSLRGYRVHLAEVESALRAHPAVASCAVVVKPADGLTRLVAYVVPVATDAPTAGDLREHLAHRLPHFMLPELFVACPTLPLTTAGKVDHAALPDLRDRPRERTPYRAPESDVERVLARLYLARLQAGRRPDLERVGVDDDFYESGGHSLLALGLLSDIRGALGVQVPLTKLLRETTVARLAPVVVECEPKPGHAATVARLWLRVADMSDDEAAGVLAAKTGDREER